MITLYFFCVIKFCVCSKSVAIKGFYVSNDIAVADEEYFYHCCITSHFLVFLGFPDFVSLCEFLLSGMTWFIFA